MLYQRTVMVVTLLFIAFNAPCPPSLYAQNQIRQSVFGNGGKAMANDEFQITGTVAQSFIGISAGGPYYLGSGLWNIMYDLDTSVETLSDEQTPTQFRLKQNYPNPFNPTTTIEFAIPEPSVVMLSIFDLLGRELAVLVEDSYLAGVYAVTFDANTLASGSYFFRIKVTSQVNKDRVYIQHKKMMVLK